MHGELLKVRSDHPHTIEVINWNDDLIIGDVDSKGIQLRPHIVWFGEAVPALDEAVSIVKQADILVVVGTSLQVYPAAGLLHYTQSSIPVFYIDPRPATIYDLQNKLEVIAMNATEGVPLLRDKLLQKTHHS